MELDPNIDQKYYLSINNITSKQPSVVSIIDIESFYAKHEKYANLND